MLIVHRLEHHIILCLTQFSDASGSICWTDLPSTEPTAAKAGAPTRVFFLLHFTHIFHKEWWDHNCPHNVSYMLN